MPVVRQAAGRPRFLSAAAADEAALNAMEEKLKEMHARIEELVEKRVDVKREAQQAAKRHQTDLENERKYGATKFAKLYLQIPDNLERAAGCVQGEDLDPEVKKMHTGVLKMQKVVDQAMKDLGIGQMQVMGEVFDPMQHEAMFAVPMAGKEPNTIFHVMEPGYVIHDRTLRAAKVGVVKAA